MVTFLRDAISQGLSLSNWTITKKQDGQSVFLELKKSLAQENHGQDVKTKNIKKSPSQRRRDRRRLQAWRTKQAEQQSPKQSQEQGRHKVDTKVRVGKPHSAPTVAAVHVAQNTRTQEALQAHFRTSFTQTVSPQYSSKLIQTDTFTPATKDASVICHQSPGSSHMAIQCDPTDLIGNIPEGSRHQINSTQEPIPSTFSNELLQAPYLDKKLLGTVKGTTKQLHRKDFKVIIKPAHSGISLPHNLHDNSGLSHRPETSIADLLQMEGLPKRTPLYGKLCGQYYCFDVDIQLGNITKPNVSDGKFIFYAGSFPHIVPINTTTPGNGNGLPLTVSAKDFKFVVDSIEVDHCKSDIIINLRDRTYYSTELSEAKAREEELKILCCQFQSENDTLSQENSQLLSSLRNGSRKDRHQHPQEKERHNYYHRNKRY